MTVTVLAASRSRSMLARIALSIWHGKRTSFIMGVGRPKPPRSDCADRKSGSRTNQCRRLTLLSTRATGPPGGRRSQAQRRSGGPGTAVITKTKPQTKRPNLYRVLLLNDDYTPMEFVVHVLERFFNKDHEAAHGS